MALYAYKAMNSNGRTVTGRLEAINPIDLEIRLKRMELDFINGDTVIRKGRTTLTTADIKVGDRVHVRANVEAGR